MLEHAALLSAHTTLLPEDVTELLSPRARRERDGDAAVPAARRLDEAERRHVELVLRQEAWVVQRAADVLGISRTSLYERIRKYGLTRPDGSSE